MREGLDLLMRSVREVTVSLRAVIPERLVLGVSLRFHSSLCGASQDLDSLHLDLYSRRHFHQRYLCRAPLCLQFSAQIVALIAYSLSTHSSSSSPHVPPIAFSISLDRPPLYAFPLSILGLSAPGQL